MSNNKIITYSVLGLISIAAIYFFIESQTLSQEMAEMRDKVEEADAAVENMLQLSAIDSLVLSGDYQAALDAYIRFEESEPSNSAIQSRITLLKSLLSARRNQNERDSNNLKTEVDTVKVTRSATPPEVRQYDSLVFAMEKANVLIKYLQSQLRNKSFGEYLTFTNRKGNEVNYVGQVKSGKANGKGVGLWNTGSRYEGEWKNNMRHGTGTHYWPDGEYYKGEYEYGLRTGQGTYYWPNGEKYVGQWEDDHRNGQGTFYGEDGKVVAQGLWKNDELVEVEKK